MALPKSGSLIAQHLTAVQKLSIANGGTRRGAMMAPGMGITAKEIYQENILNYHEVKQIDTLKFLIGGGVHHSIWEWLINSPYEVKMTDKSQIEFLDPAGAVAFKLMFVKGPRDGTPGDNAT